MPGKDEKLPKNLSEQVQIGTSETAPTVEDGDLKVEELTHKVDAEITAIEAVVVEVMDDIGTDPELAQEIAELTDLRREAVQVRITMMEKLLKILKKPIILMREAKIEKRRKEFDREDSPVVIKELRGRVRKLSKFDGKKDKPNIAELETIVKDYIGANKADEDKWGYFLNELSTLMEKYIHSFAEKENPTAEDLDQVLAIWKYFPANARGFNSCIWVAVEIHKFKDRLVELELKKKEQAGGIENGSEESRNLWGEIYNDLGNKLNSHVDLLVTPYITNYRGTTWSNHSNRNRLSQEARVWFDKLKDDPMKRDFVAYLPVDNSFDRRYAENGLNSELFSEEERKTFFESCLKLNPENIINNANLFQDLIDKLDESGRRRLLLSVTSDYQLRGFLNFIKLTKEELKLGVKTLEQRSSRLSPNEPVPDEKVDNFLVKCKESTSNFLVMATNPELFDYTVEQTYEVLSGQLSREIHPGNIAEDVKIFLQYFSNPNKYPQLRKERMQGIFVDWISDLLIKVGKESNIVCGYVTRADDYEREITILLGSVIEGKMLPESSINKIFGDYFLVDRNYNLISQINDRIEYFDGIGASEEGRILSQAEIAELRFYRELTGLDPLKIPKEQRFQKIEEVLLQKGSPDILSNYFFKLINSGKKLDDPEVYGLAVKLLKIGHAKQLLEFVSNGFMYRSDTLDMFFDDLLEAILREKASAALDELMSMNQFTGLRWLEFLGKHKVSKEKIEELSEAIVTIGGPKIVLALLDRYLARMEADSETGEGRPVWGRYIESTPEQRQKAVDRMIKNTDYSKFRVDDLKHLIHLVSEDYPERRDELLASIIGSNDYDLLRKFSQVEIKGINFTELSNGYLLSLKDNFGSLVDNFNKFLKLGLVFSEAVFTLIGKKIDELDQKKNQGEISQEESELLNKARNSLIELFIQFNPTVARTFHDPKKLGVMKGLIINKLFEFYNQLAEKKLPLSVVRVEMSKKLQEIKRMFDSSDVSESEKRLLFLDMYNLEECFDKELVESTRASSTSDEFKRKLRDIVQADVQEVVRFSGNEREIRNLRRKGETSKIEEIERILAEADKRNRQIYEDLMAGKSSAELLLSCEDKTAAITHGAKSQSLALILEAGNLPGELLGPDTKRDGSGLLGTDVSRVTVVNNSPDFSDRLKKLKNYIDGYGDIHIVYSNYRQSESGKKRPPKHSGVIGEDHELVLDGIPSSEITGVVIKVSNQSVIDNVKKDIATWGGYINVMDAEGKMLLSPQEFDELKMFYNRLSKLGYPREVINGVYKYYKSDGLGPKHRMVIDKAVAAIQSGESKEDLVVLVSFLSSNDLNKGPLPSEKGKESEEKAALEWYRDSSFEEIMEFIRSRTRSKIKLKAVKDIFEGTNRVYRKVNKGESASFEVSGLDRELQENYFITNFFEHQLPYVLFGKKFVELNDEEMKVFKQEAKKYINALAHLVDPFSESKLRALFTKISSGSVDSKGSDEKEKIRVASSELITVRLQEIAQLFTEQKKQLMKRLWADAWVIAESGNVFDPNLLEKFKKIIIPAIAGSGGRVELALGSDIDYNLLVDDTVIEEEGKIQFLSKLEDFVNNYLKVIINDLMADKKVIADAGKANKDEKPLVFLSAIDQLKVKADGTGKQTVEPTAVIDLEPFFADGQRVTDKAKELLFKDDERVAILPLFIQKDLEIGKPGKEAYVDQFEKLYQDVSTGKMMERIKFSLQRSIMMKVDYLIFSGIAEGKIDRAKGKEVPASLVGKINFLMENNVLTEHEADICEQLLSMSYKLRFLSEMYSDQAKQEGTNKADNAQFKVEDISYQERQTLIVMLKAFKDEVLYK